MHALAEIAPGDVDAERQRQARLEQPPLAEIEHLVEAGLPVRQLALVDHEPGVGAAGRDLVEDLVELQLAVSELTEREPKREERRRHPARHDDLGEPQLVEGQRLAGDEDRPVAGADAGPVRQQCIPVLHEWVRVQRDRSHLEAALERPLVQGLDVLQDLLEPEAPRVDRAGGDRPEHERVVRIRAVSELDQHQTRLAPA